MNHAPWPCMQFVVLSSAGGTTFQAAIDAMRSGSLTMRCLGLITDREDRGCIQKAQAAGLPVKIVKKTKEEPREAFDDRVHAAILELLKECAAPVDGTILAEMGWMWIHTPRFIGRWKNRILNVHPSLLPKYGGKGMYGNHVHEAVLAAGEHESGMTIHIMDEGVDTGEYLVQKSCSIEPNETVESLKAKAQALEKEWYPKTLQMIECGDVRLPSS